jgi:quercetin dioxygenase-like cupin family protein
LYQEDKLSEQDIRWPGQSAASREETTQVMPAVILPQSAKTLRAFGDEVYVHLGGAETGGKYTVFTITTPPGSGPPPHYHNHEDEWFYVLEGQVEFLLDGAWKKVPVGAHIFIPRSKVHTFRNCGEQQLKMLTHTSPSGFEIFFERCAAEFAKPGPPDMDRIIKISAEHGIHFVME